MTVADRLASVMYDLEHTHNFDHTSDFMKYIEAVRSEIERCATNLRLVAEGMDIRKYEGAELVRLEADRLAKEGEK